VGTLARGNVGKNDAGYRLRQIPNPKLATTKGTKEKVRRKRRKINKL